MKLHIWDFQHWLSLWEVELCYEVRFLLRNGRHGFSFILFFLRIWVENINFLSFSQERILSANVLTGWLASWSISHIIAADHKCIIITTTDATMRLVGVDESPEMQDLNLEGEIHNISKDKDYSNRKALACSAGWAAALNSWGTFALWQ